VAQAAITLKAGETAMNNARLLVAAMLVAAPVTLHATPITYSTAEAVSIRNCIVGTTNPCEVGAPPAVPVAYGGFAGAASSSASNSLSGYGSAVGHVSLSGTIGAPILSAGAASEAGARVNTNSVALQRYTYTGLDATTVTLEATLRYSQALTGDYQDSGDGIVASIDVFTVPTATVDVGDTPLENFLAIFDPSAFPGYVQLGAASFTDPTASVIHGVGTFGVTVTLTPGEMVWVDVLLQTPAPNGSVLDATHTLVTGWSDPAFLVPAVALPEPETLALLGAGIAAFAASLRRRRTPG
jgi:hypothetical protein